MNQATNCMLDESAKGVWLAWDVGKTLKAEIQDEMRVGNIVALSQFVDSLKEWCDETSKIPGNTLAEKWIDVRKGSECRADSLLAFAVQRLELIKTDKI